MKIIERWKAAALALRREAVLLYIAIHHPRVPWYAKAVLGVTVAYLLSPIDLIPDFVPVLGYLDDLVIVPCGIALAMKMIPRDVLEECRSQAAAAAETRRGLTTIAVAGAVLVIIAWALLIVVLAAAFVRL